MVPLMEGVCEWGMWDVCWKAVPEAALKLLSTAVLACPARVKFQLERQLLPLAAHCLHRVPLGR